MYDQSHLADTLDVSYTNESIDLVAKHLTSLVQKFTSLRNILDRDHHIIHHLKAQTLKEVDNEEMAQRLFDSMMKHGGPGSISVAERPFYHPNDYIWKYFMELSSALEVKVTKYAAMLDDLERQIHSFLSSLSGSGVVGYSGISGRLDDVRDSDIGNRASHSPQGNLIIYITVFQARI